MKGILEIAVKAGLAALLILTFYSTGLALEPDEILIIANSEVPASVQIARYYCEKRAVPKANVLALPLGVSLSDTIVRDDYEKHLAEPIRKKLLDLEFGGKTGSRARKRAFGSPIRCLLTTYGVPIKVDGRGPLKNQEESLKHLREQTEQLKNEIEKIEQSNSVYMRRQKQQIHHKLAQLQSEIDRIIGKETSASVDSELSMVPFGNYELYRWQPNNLKNNVLYWDFKTLMVCRLDGPGPQIAKAIVDKAIRAEKTGLKGIAYIDSRGIEYPEPNKSVSGSTTYNKNFYSPAYFDQSLRNLAVLTRLRTELPVEQEQTEKLFEPGTCLRTAIYCGWYSLKKYVDAFDFVDGAVGYHISSLEAANLRDPNSSQWCPAMLKDGITATLGAVDEPYLHSFPEPGALFLELFNGQCLVEAYYRTKPFNSWRLVLIGDPLYKPFKKP